ncbi:MAG: GtrA family protein [Bifidobacteriaceae bacterium]|nr:GtrA family protein [Bifidobacteriaceae bacterium]MCI1915049.1 GtrA family protein [Bifidobacteriaceae bacterium]
MKNLIAQLVKFGLVGGIAFAIDWGIFNLLIFGFHTNATLSATISFLISLVFNYVASMKFVFTRREDMAKWMEMIIFFISSAIGLLINDLIIWFATSVLLPDNAMATSHGTYGLYANAAKLVATVIVSVWNFVIRKWLLDAPAEGKQARPLARKIGQWSLDHTPRGWQR